MIILCTRDVRVYMYICLRLCMEGERERKREKFIDNQIDD